jgi:hypothetical protein
VDAVDGITHAVLARDRFETAPPFSPEASWCVLAAEGPPSGRRGTAGEVVLPVDSVQKPPDSIGAPDSILRIERLAPYQQRSGLLDQGALNAGPSGFPLTPSGKRLWLRLCHANGQSAYPYVTP